MICWPLFPLKKHAKQYWSVHMSWGCLAEKKGHQGERGQKYITSPGLDHVKEMLDIEAFSQIHHQGSS